MPQSARDSHGCATEADGTAQKPTHSDTGEVRVAVARVVKQSGFLSSTQEDPAPVQPSNSTDNKLPQPKIDAELTPTPLPPAPKLPLIDEALEVASNKSVPLLDRLRTLSDLLPRSLPCDAAPSAENRSVALGILTCAAEACGSASFPRAQREFADLVSPTVSHAALLVIPDSSPAELGLIANACRNVERVAKRVYSELLVRALQLTDTAPSEVLANVLCATPPSKVELHTLWELASVVLARAENLPSEVLIRCAEKLCSCDGSVPSHAEALASEFLRRISTESFSLACDFSDNMHTLCRQNPESLHSSRSPESYAQLCDVYNSWRTALAGRSNEVVPRLLLVRDISKRNGDGGRRRALREFESIDSSLCKAPESFSVSDAVALAYAASRLLYRSDSFCFAIARRCEAEVESLSDKDLASMIRSFGRLGFRDLQFLKRAADEACKRFDALKPHHALQITSALFHLQALPERVAQAALRHVLTHREQYPESDYALTLWCLSSVMPEVIRTLCSADHLPKCGDPGSWVRTFQTLIACGKFVSIDSTDEDTQRRVRRQQVATPSRLESAVLKHLSYCLQDLNLQIMPNPLVAGIEVDILVKSANRQFIIEIDGHLYHSLAGPDGSGLLFGVDVMQDNILQRLGYTVFHLKTSHVNTERRLRAAVENVTAKIREKVLDDASKGTSVLFPRYPYSPLCPVGQPESARPASAGDGPIEGASTLHPPG